PHLHFMWIRDGEHCDPAPFLRPPIAPGIRPSEWPSGGLPPGLRCIRWYGRPRGSTPPPPQLFPASPAETHPSSSSTGEGESAEAPPPSPQELP
ncbi:MAG: hypothetical protein NZM37_05985, partial [Sandaracinaceae bacterium]|nr:hypothetical protein [Sandaracinaceae bacterium]